MLDVVINEAGGLTVAHDQKSLDDYDALYVDPLDGRARLVSPSGSVHLIGSLKPAMLAQVRDGMAGQVVRTSDWSIASHGKLAVHLHSEV